MLDATPVSPTLRLDNSTRRPRARKPAPQVGKKIKTAVHLSPEAIRKLGAACVYEMTTQSQLIEHLIMHQLSTYSVAAREEDRRIKFAAPSDRSKTAVEVSASA